jgi:hypothetical protein
LERLGGKKLSSQEPQQPQNRFKYRKSQLDHPHCADNHSHFTPISTHFHTIPTASPFPVHSRRPPGAASLLVVHCNPHYPRRFAVKRKLCTTPQINVHPFTGYFAPFVIMEVPKPETQIVFAGNRLSDPCGNPGCEANQALGDAQKTSNEGQSGGNP